jgi:hypothetical protein
MHRTMGLMALLLLSLPVQAWAYHVAPTGSDSADGSAQHPWATVQHAAKMAKAGDTVHVAPGEYREVVTTRANGTATARVRFVSDTRWGAKIRTHGAGACWDNYGDYVDIEGFDISGDGWIGIENWGSYVRMIGNHVHDIPARGTGGNGGAGIVNGNPRAHDSDIIGNVVHDIGDPEEASTLVHGIYLANAGGLIANNIVYRCQGLGIHCWHAADRATIANNLVFENQTGGIVVGAGDSPGGVIADHFLVTNNIAIYNKRYGISEYGEVGTHNRYLHNLVFGNARGGVRLLHGNLEQGTVAADPNLVNYRPDGTGDYHLAAGSPAIDAGTPLGAPATDLDGTARPQGAAIDIGPYEYGPGGSSKR